MPDDMKELLAQQQQFAQQLMQQQQQWMESILARNRDAPRATELTACPPFPHFNKDSQNWETYLQQLSQHFVAYSVLTAEKQKAYFLSWVGTDVFELVKNLFGSENLDQQTYAQITEKLTEHYKEKRHIVAARYEFFKRQMRDSQTHKEWVADLRGIARECQFVCKSENCSCDYVNEMIRDQIIVHTPFDKIRTAALQKLQPSLEDVLSIAETYEATTKTVSAIKESEKKALDTNAVYTQKHQHKKRSGVKERNDKNSLKSCSGCVLGELRTMAKCGNKEANVVIIVANVNNSNNLFGLDLFKTFNFEIQQVSNVSEAHSSQMTNLCNKYKEVFEPAIGTIKNFKASIYLKPNSVPKFYKSRPIPFAQMEKFKEEAQRLTDAGIWKPVKFSSWASPIVLAPKPGGALRICGDFKQGVNSQLDIEQYPLPTRESLLHAIRCGTHFSKIDLKDAYLQMELDEEAKEIMVVNTPLGLFQYQRLPYGIASAPAIFQRHLEQLLSGIEGCGNYLDDIIISAPTVEQHLARIEQILCILQENGIRCKKEKCFFLQDEIEYLGRRVSTRGILPDNSGLAAVKELKPPTNLQQLDAFMGKVNYYCNFIPNYSQLASPLNQLRRKNTPFKFGPDQQQAFTALKTHILNATELAHFNENLPLVLATDASSFGIGVVLSHIQPDGKERPIAFASKTLDVHQVRYSQIEKEALSIIFGVKKFHQYLYGRKFILITDHKPLVTIFNPSKHLPTMTSNRLQRWAIILMAYNFEIKYRSTAAHGNADALSRLPISSDAKFDKEEACYNVVDISCPINIDIIKQHMESDKVLKRVYNFVSTGWPEQQHDPEILPYFNRRLALTINNNLLCLHTDISRVIMPHKLRKKILNLLHDGHWGIVRMKQLARQHVWWPGIDEDIAQMAKGCSICKVANPAPVKEFLSWPKPTSAWERIHIDFAGPIFDSMWLICVDAYSQFPFITQMTSTTTANTIAALTSIFAIEGYPKTLVSDNGPQLTAESFQEFCKQHGINHITTAPFHPASNGLAERFVQTFKTSVSKNIKEGYSVKTAVTKYLSSYRFTPNAEGKSPAELLHGRQVRTILSQIFEKQTESKPMQEAKYSANQAVFAKNYARGEKWIKATIDRSVGRMLYILRTSTGFIKRHVNQIKPRSDSEDISSNSSHDNDEFWWAPESPKPPTTPTATIPEDDPQPVSSQQPQSVPASIELPGTSQQNVQQPPQPRRSATTIRSCFLRIVRNITAKCSAATTATPFGYSYPQQYSHTTRSQPLSSFGL
ncbi:hypothetical protein ACLKA6_020051 [Drosophila palustris]